MTYEQIIVLISVIVAGITGLGTIITGVRGYYWSKDYKESKQAQLDEKDTLIESLKELSPKKMRESYLSLKDQLEEYIEQLKSKIKDLERLVGDLEENNKSLSDELKVSENIIGKLKREISNFKIKESEKRPAQEWLNNIGTSIDNSKVLQVKSSGLQMTLRDNLEDMENVVFVPATTSEGIIWDGEGITWDGESTNIFIDPDRQGYVISNKGIQFNKNDESNDPEDEVLAGTDET